jgi:hypothetical protein
LTTMSFRTALVSASLSTPIAEEERMNVRPSPRVRILAAGASVFATAVLVAARPGFAQAGACPSGGALKNFKTASNVAAVFSNSGAETTYWFVSLTDENPVAGVPGLIKYCVYPSPSEQPAAIDVQAKGANGADWISMASGKRFAFARPAGSPSNIPLDGTSVLMGTATWNTVPTDQAILLHIADAGVCAALYGSDSPGTCFVKPSLAPICSAGDGESGVAYNAMPFGAVNCATYSVGFEADSASELGDEVHLAGSSRELVSLSVLFASWGCQSGHWFSGDCATTPGATFTHPITATIYAVADCSGTPCPGAPLATTTGTFTIAYRPSADPVKCTGPDAGKWFNTAAGLCKPQISQVLTFAFAPGTILPDDVIWTVAFNTTHYGSAPIGEGAACFSSSGGCPYDSLNVGAETFTGAPYAGTDVDPNGAFFDSSAAAFYCDGGVGGVGVLRLDTSVSSCWDKNKPLGAIRTK